MDGLEDDEGARAKGGGDNQCESSQMKWRKNETDIDDNTINTILDNSAHGNKGYFSCKTI
jgi:hypothetical protein